MAQPFPPGICIIVTRRCVSVFAAHQSSAIITIAMTTAVDTYQLGPVYLSLLLLSCLTLIQLSLHSQAHNVQPFLFTRKLTMCSHFYSLASSQCAAISIHHILVTVSIIHPLCYCFHNMRVFHKTLMMPVVQTLAHNCSPWVHHCHLVIGM